MSRIVIALTTIVGLNYFIACCHNDDRPPPHDPSKVVVVCANSGDAAQQPEEFDAGPAGASWPVTLTKENVYREACRTMAAFKCPESKKLPEGLDCESNLKNIAPVSPFDPYCVARAKSAAEIRKCPDIECKL
jgi:hypothetical protein